MRPQKLVQTVQNLSRAEILDAGERTGKIHPKIAQHLLPVELMVGDEVEFLLKRGGKIIADVAGEKTFQKSRHETAFVFGDEPLLVEANVVALAQNREGRSVGRRPADAKLLHAFDECRLCEARRRL